MSEQQFKVFLEKVKGDTSLQEELKAAADNNAIAAIAKEAGFSISADDLTKAQSELSEEELEGVAAGTQDGVLLSPDPDLSSTEEHLGPGGAWL